MAIVSYIKVYNGGFGDTLKNKTKQKKKKEEEEKRRESFWCISSMSFRKVLFLSLSLFPIF